MLVTDPYENESSLRFPRTLDPDVVVLSHQDQTKFNTKAFTNKPFLIADPGEYEVKGVFIDGIQDPAADEGVERPLIHRFISENMSIAFLGQLNRKLTNTELEKLENIDILLLPIGGGAVLDDEKAADLIGVIEPRIVIPMYYAIPGIKQKLGSVDAFCKHLGTCQKEEMTKLKVQRKDLPADNILVAVLERS
jgi:Predicted Zn-dependent hydrolases of the beta-lactamase fold